MTEGLEHTAEVNPLIEGNKDSSENPFSDIRREPPKPKPKYDPKTVLNYNERGPPSLFDQSYK